MGYYIKKLPLKKSLPNWKLQFVSYKNEDVKSSTANKPKKAWDIEKSRWRALGFHSGQSIEEAKIRARQLNFKAHIKNQEKRIQQIRRLDVATQKRNEFCLPVEFVGEFEKRFLRVRDSETINGRRKKSRAHIIWRTAQKSIAAIQIEPSEWFYHTLVRQKLNALIHSLEICTREVHFCLNVQRACIC